MPECMNFTLILKNWEKINSTYLCDGHLSHSWSLFVQLLEISCKSTDYEGAAFDNWTSKWNWIQYITLTEHGFKLDQAANEIVKVNHLIVCIPGDQDLVQFVVEFKTCKRKQATVQRKLGINSLECDQRSRAPPAASTARRISYELMAPDLSRSNCLKITWGTEKRNMSRNILTFIYFFKCEFF